MLFLLFALFYTSGCKKPDAIQNVVNPFVPSVVVTPPANTFAGPLAADDYTPIASYANRAQWNLANVHDPTVEKSGDYYYMYGTDASYGNVLEGHGHFPYRRSKDLVKWEFMGTAFATVPA